MRLNDLPRMFRPLAVYLQTNLRLRRSGSYKHSLVLAVTKHSTDTLQPSVLASMRGQETEVDPSIVNCRCNMFTTTYISAQRRSRLW